MSESGGVSSGYVDSAISSLRRELLSEIRDVQRDVDSLRRWTEQEIQRLENEMREIGEMIVSAIDRQTIAVVGGVAATTLMIERTKLQIEDDFSKTRSELELQTESALQIEIGKKLADASALKNKLAAFIGDVKTRFDRSIASVAINRELYNVNFKKITDEYQNKIKTIGDHIFKIKLEDIAPAIESAKISYEMAHELPIEMDLKRLSVRSENLDDTLGLLRSSRLDEVLSSLETLKLTLGKYEIPEVKVNNKVSYCVEGIITSTPISTKIISGRLAREINDATDSQEVNLFSPEFDLQIFESGLPIEKINTAISNHEFRPMLPKEIKDLSEAAKTLEEKKLISSDAHALFLDFLASGNLKRLGSK